jgi:hypothetical protein
MLSRKPIVRRNRERKAPPIEKSTYLGEPKFCNRGRKSYVEDWVIERIIAVNDNPQLKVIDRKTVNGVFYIVRPRMLDTGFEVKLQHRVKVTSTYIREVCEQHGYYRSELGIVTAARAQIYYHGVTYDVNEDNIKMLSKLGTDLVVIEKEGVVKALAPFADKYRIALMYTRGFPIEYVQMIVDVINENNRHVLLVTDFDTAGIQIGLNLNDIVRIGINFKTIEYFFSDKLRQHPGNETLGKFISDAKIVKELEEVYEHAEEDSHLTSLKDQLPGGKNNPIVKYFQPNVSIRVTARSMRGPVTMQMRLPCISLERQHSQAMYLIISSEMPNPVAFLTQI